MRPVSRSSVRKNSAAATNGKSPDQAEKSKMQVKKERDAEKYQGQSSESMNHTGNR